MASFDPQTASFLCGVGNLATSLLSLFCLSGVLLASSLLSSLLPDFLYSLVSWVVEVPATLSSLYLLLSLASLAASLLQVFATRREECRLVRVCLLYHLASLLVDGLLGLVVCLVVGPWLVAVGLVDALTTATSAWVTFTYWRSLEEGL